MSKQFSPKQAFILWSLLITEEEPKMSKFKPSERKPLLENGLIRLEKRGRANYIVLEDKAWDWAIDNFEAKLSLSPSAGPVLQALLTKLGRYFNNNQISLAEVLTPLETVDESVSEIENTPNAAQLSTDDLIQKIRQAYFSIPDGQEGFRVRLHDLRSKLSEFSVKEVNHVLLTMQSKGEISLRKAEDLQELNTDDEAAAIDMGGGDKRYFVRIKK